MTQPTSTNSRFAQMVTTDLLEAIKTGQRVDAELISYAEDVIQVHQLIVQLAFVGLIIDWLPQLSNYNVALDNLVEQIDTEDMAEATIGEKIRAASVLNQSIKTTVDVITHMMASKDAVNMLIASLKDTFGPENAALLEEGGANKNLIERFQRLPTDQRQQLLAGVVTLIKTKMPQDEIGEMLDDDE